MIAIPKSKPRNPFWKTKKASIPHGDRRKRTKHKLKEHDENKH